MKGEGSLAFSATDIRSRMAIELVIWFILLGLAALLFFAIVNGWMKNSGGSAVSITA
jgi:hypothetical protein